MHPEIVSSHASDCDICGMDLVRTETLGYAAPESGEAPLVIPATAPLITGRRAVVYVEVPGADRPTFEGREVVLGSRAGDAYVVESGLQEGERVVVNGAFKIDSAMQIQAKPSMMMPEGGASGGGHQHGAPASTQTHEESRQEMHGSSAVFREQLSDVARAAADVSTALAADDHGAATTAATKMLADLESVDMHGLDSTGHELWMEILGALKPAIAAAASGESIDATREALPAISRELTSAIRSFGIESELELSRFHCPMAFDGAGADWLQTGETTANPYYGASMLRCGSAVENFSEQGGER
jgi:Cu(I)/Ag(I) efflux system membrane fusion protein